MDSFFSTELINEVPRALMLRDFSIMWFSLSAVTFSFILLAFSRLASNNIIQVFIKLVLNNNNISKIIKEEYALDSIRSILLSVNFIVTSLALSALFIIGVYVEFDLTNTLYSSLIPVYFFIWPFITLKMVEFITGESKMLEEIKLNNYITTQFLGIIFSFLLLIWAFNFKWSEYFSTVFIALLILTWLFRFLRAIIFSFQHGVTWYYFILYLCTLEILPVLVLFTYISKNFGSLEIRV